MRYFLPIAILLSILLGLLFYSYSRSKDTSVVKPQSTDEILLSIIEPVEGKTISSQMLQIKGRTEPKAFVFINGKEMRADEQGIFSASAILDEGENTIFIVSHTEDGQYAEKDLLVNLEVEN
ncbi:hypothetical protein HYW87_00835 [Candidatus Roizmanbacteria bacterium]|nr:hypothetical protein [Candidatus Roizmanbacteria bacterium]